MKDQKNYNFAVHSATHAWETAMQPRISHKTDMERLTAVQVKPQAAESRTTKPHGTYASTPLYSGKSEEAKTADPHLIRRTEKMVRLAGIEPTTFSSGG